jgi:hypothetical protein
MTRDDRQAREAIPVHTGAPSEVLSVTISRRTLLSAGAGSLRAGASPIASSQRLCAVS